MSLHAGSRTAIVGLLEDINSPPEVLIRGVYDFLGVRSNFRPPKMGRKVNSRGRSTAMPTDVTRLLYARCIPELENLSTIFGGYTAFWLSCTRRLASGEFSEDHIKTPMVQSPLWDDWRAESKDSISEDPGELFMSGRLSTFGKREDVASKRAAR